MATPRGAMSPRAEDDTTALRRARPVTSNLTEERVTYISCEMERKRIQQDSILLANRIALLQGEEVKAVKKIRETQKRARELLDSRARNEERKQRAQEEKARRVSAQNALMEKVQQDREDQRRRIAEKRQALQAQKAAQRKEVRSHKEELLQTARFVEDDHNKYRSYTRDYVLSSRAQCKAKQEDQQKRIHEVCHKNFQDKFEMTEMSLEYQLEVKERMSIEELTLIERLQASQQLQRSAYYDLERLMHGEPIPEESLLFQTAKSLDTTATPRLKAGESPRT